MEGRDSDSFAISCVVMLMDGAGRREKHARAGREERGVVDPLVEFLQEFFGVLFQVVDAGFEGEERGIIQTVVVILEVHQCLPSELDIEIVGRFE
jgi:hypothetical protein